MCKKEDIAGEVAIITRQKIKETIKSLRLNQLTRLISLSSFLAEEIYFITTRFIEPGIIPKSPMTEISASNSPYPVEPNNRPIKKWYRRLSAFTPLLPKTIIRLPEKNGLEINLFNSSFMLPNTPLKILQFLISKK